MSRAKAVTELAIFQALDAYVTGATVYQDAPEDADGDLVILGDMKSFRLETKGASADRRVLVQIITIAAAEERLPILRLQEQIEDVLDGGSFEIDGFTLSVEFQEDDAVLAEDGVTYSGISTFSVLALAD